MAAKQNTCRLADGSDSRPVNSGTCRIGYPTSQPLLLATVVVMAALGRSPESVAESPDAYEIVVAAAVPVLPEPMRAFFETRIEGVRRSATFGGMAGVPGSAMEGAGFHYVMLDVAAGGSADPHEAAKRFPRDREAAERLFKQHGVKRGGTLPWALRDRYQALALAFAEADPEHIVSNAGLLLHLATDASLPFNTSALHRTEAGAQPVRQAPAGSAHGKALGDARHRIQVVLIKAMREQLDYEVRVWPGLFDPVTDPLDAAFDALLAAHDALDPLVRIDLEVLERLSDEEGRKHEGLAFSEALYPERTARHAGPLMESRLEAAALLGAGLIGGAWIQAGRPHTESLAGDDTPTSRGKPPPLSESQVIVGSRNSTVFHEATCSHAVRIKPENLVRFPSVEEARKAGRKPCKACSPGEE